MKKRNLFYKIIDYILVVSLVILSLSKGGFYKSDILITSVVISLVSLIYLVVNLVTRIKEKCFKLDCISIALFILFVAYLLPIIFKNYADLNSAIFEAIRYFNLFTLYNIVKNSDSKKIYLKAIVIITVLQCILSIDAVGLRYFEDLLKNFDSGYINVDLKRMSGTLQYANTLAILCLISIIIITKKTMHVMPKKRYVLNFISLFLLITTLVLTGTRAVILLFLVYVIICLIKSLKAKKSYNSNHIKQIGIEVFLLTLLVFSYTSIIYNVMFSIKVYGVALLYILVSFFVALFLKDRIRNNTIEKGIADNKLAKVDKLNNINSNSRLYNLNRFVNKNKVICNFGITLFGCISIITLFSISKPLYLNSNRNNNSDVIILENVKENQNNIRFKITNCKEDARYNIVLTKRSFSNVEEKIKEFSFANTTSGNFEYNFNLDKDTKYLCMYVTCKNGKIKLDNINLNEKNQKADYLFMPRNLVYRFKDLLSGSTSTTDRLTYYMDALKIISKTPLNFVIGTGGEGFKNIYEYVKTKDYTSSEVHSSFLQIFVESGVIGFVCIIMVLMYVLIKAKNNNYKLVFCIFVAHSFIDLNFSYMLMILVFGILLANLDYTNDDVRTENNYHLISNFITIILSLVVFTICLKSIVARHMSTLMCEEKDLTLEKQTIIVNQNEKRVKLDKYEFDYLKELNEQYKKYLYMLDKEGDYIEIEKVKKLAKRNLNRILDSYIFDKEKINYVIENLNLYL